MVEEQFIEQNYWTRQSLKNNGIAEKLGSVFALREDEFMPTALYGSRLTKKRNEKFSRSNADKFIMCIDTPDINYVVLTNRDKFSRDLIFGLRINMLDNFSLVSFCVSNNYFKEEGNTKKFENIGKEIIGIINPIYGKIHDVEDSNRIMGERVFNVIEKIPDIFWGNYFGKEYVDRIGNEIFFSAPAYKKEQFNNGAMYLQLSENPLDFAISTVNKSRKEIAKHLNIKSYG